jgi:predicted RNA methylase
MFETIVALILIVITIILLMFLLSMVWPPDSPWSPWWRTNRRIALIQCRLAKISAKDKVYDLGCGDGTALITAAQEFGAQGVGVEIDPLRVWTAKVRVQLKGLNKKIKLTRKNFFAVDVSDATVIIMYLIPKTLAKLRKKLLKECKPGTRIITFVYKIDLPIIAQDLQNEVYIYEIPKEKNKSEASKVN